MCFQQFERWTLVNESDHSVSAANPGEQRNWETGKVTVLIHTRGSRQVPRKVRVDRRQHSTLSLESVVGMDLFLSHVVWRTLSEVVKLHLFFALLLVRADLLG